MKVLSLSILLATISTNVFASSSSSSSCPGESGFNYINYRQRNPTQGGFVSHQAYVEDVDNVFISPTAAVCGSSSITGSVKIFGTAIVKNATISGNVNIKDDAYIIGANVSEDAIISGKAYINGTDVIIRGKAQVSGNAIITGDAIIGGTSIAGGYARIFTGVYSTEIIKPGRTQDDPLPCGLKGSIENRIKDCSYWVSSVSDSFVLVTRTTEYVEFHKDTKSGILWAHHLPSRLTYYDALKACETYLPPEGGIGGLKWRLPSIEEYLDADTHGIRLALPSMFGSWWSSSLLTDYGLISALTFNGHNGGKYAESLSNDNYVRCVAR